MDEQEQTSIFFEVSLENNHRFTYTKRLVEVENILGTSTDSLLQYMIANSNGEIYTLYKTREGNWYDMTAETSRFNTAMLKDLKNAIDNFESSLKST